MNYTMPGFPANRNELANADKMYTFKARRRTFLVGKLLSHAQIIPHSVAKS